MPFSLAFLERETPEFISPLLLPPNSPDLNPVSLILREKVYKTRITDLDDLKHRSRTDETKLDHAVIAAAISQWRRRLSDCQGGRWSFQALFLMLTLCFAITAAFEALVD